MTKWVAYIETPAPHLIEAPDVGTARALAEVRYGAAFVRVQSQVSAGITVETEGAMSRDRAPVAGPLPKHRRRRVRGPDAQDTQSGRVPKRATER